MQAIQDNAPIDAFLSYREGETRVSEINEQLKQNGLRTHYFHDTVKPGDPVDEGPALSEAHCMVVFLGDRGWGRTQLQQVATFQSTGRRILPVRIGAVSEAAGLELGGLFSRLLYVDLTKHDDTKLAQLVQAIREANGSTNELDPLSRVGREPSLAPNASPDEPPTSARIAHVLHILKDGSDRERLDALRQLGGLHANDRGALAFILRRHLRGDFAVGTEDNFAAAVRSPKRLASIRSWMLSALIQLDAEGNADLILQHLQESYEPDRNVRFWTLAGLYGRQVSFADDAIDLAQGDKEPEILLLAELMCRSSEPELVEELTKRLQASDFETVWQVLRALRIVPVPPLAPVLTEMLFSSASDTALAYDVLYAFTPPPMAKAAAPLLLERWTSARVTREIVTTTAGSAYQAGEHFVHLLSLLPPSETIGALKQCLSDPRLRHSAEQLLNQLHRLNNETASRARHRPGFHSDKPGDTTDRLGITAEARTFAAIMTAHDVSPPLAIGLFGDWGSGKSFFMGEMRRQAEAFSDQAKLDDSSPFCAQVEHIEFNAWHYADSNLWASLVSCMLEKLHGRVNGLKTPAEERAEIERQMLQAVQDQQSAVLKAEQAAEELRRKSEQLATAEAERQQRPVKVTELGAEDWKRLIEKDANAKKAIATIAQRLGMGDLMAATTDWQAALSELRSQTEVSVSLARAVSTESRRPLWVALLVAVIVIPPVALAVNHWLATDQTQAWMVKLGAIFAQITAVLVGSATWIRKAMASFSDRRKDLESARDWVNQLLQAKRDEVPASETQLKAEVDKATAAKVAADQQVAAAQVEITRLEVEREKISLARFLSDRHKSDDYRKQLGIFTTIRRDFEILVDRLKPAPGRRAQLDRIVLYIDDLDRCPADKVVEVLQAVHLLLAYPLFVVVVGVDSRWLLHSLSSHFKQFDEHVARLSRENEDDESEHWTATPQHYLEKIFQIPYALRPMTDGGFSQMMDALLKPAGDGYVLPPIVSEVTPEEPTAPTTGSGITRYVAVPEDQASRLAQQPNVALASSVPKAGADDKGASGPAPQQAGSSDESQDTVLDEAALTIQAWETEYAKRLHAFIPSPRAAKRFSNVYRIMKATVPANELARFEGSANFPGEFRVAMILLAQQISSPHRAAQWFEFLAEQPPAGRLDDALLHPPEGRHHVVNGIKEALEGLITDDARDLPIERVQHWLAIVGRFSFDLTRRRI
ncbi:MAG: P-loop NTPase fold protein [Roseateles sp.]|uniref:P-loop NTPase fold protein n=1 Tax=Roseateles sp. TaxID=1971397 RepID=UPI0040360786